MNKWARHPFSSEPYVTRHRRPLHPGRFTQTCSPVRQKAVGLKGGPGDVRQIGTVQGSDRRAMPPRLPRERSRLLGGWAGGRAARAREQPIRAVRALRDERWWIGAERAGDRETRGRSSEMEWSSERRTPPRWRGLRPIGKARGFRVRETGEGREGKERSVRRRSPENAERLSADDRVRSWNGRNERINQNDHEKFERK